MILPTAALSRKKNRGQTNLPRRAAPSSAPSWDKPRDRTTKRAALQKGLLVLAEVTKSDHLQGPSGCRTSADVRVTISGSNRGQDARDENKSTESGGKSGERPRGNCLCKPPAPVARTLERNPTTPITNWKSKLLAFLHDPPHKPRAVAAHEDQRQSFLNRLGLDADALKAFDRSNDWQAPAADRLVFPNSLN
jgi:hypothetical protein